MKKDNVLGAILMSCGLLQIISVFLPYVSYYGRTASLWNLESPSRLIYILLGLFVIILYLLNKKTEMSYLAAGYGFFTEISTIISNGGFSGLSISFYLILLISIAIAVLTFLYNEEEADEIISLTININKPTNNNVENVNQTSQVIPENNIVNQPKNQSVARFDPMTGERIYNNQNN